MARAYLGQGINHPPVVTELGRIALVNDLELINQSILRILNTPLGSVFRNREYGSKLNELIFEPNDNILIALLDFFVFDSIEKWEKRITPKSIEFNTPDNKPELIEIQIYYEVLGSSEVDSFIYPFYRELKRAA